MAKRRKTYAEYSEEYGVSESTVKGWIRRGRELGHRCPLDSPKKMAAWRALYFERQSFHEFLPAGEVDESTPRSEPRDFSGVKPLDFEANVEKLRHTLAVHQRLFDDALIAGSDEKISMHQHNLERCMNTLRQAEKDLTEIQKIRGDLIDKESVLAELAQQSETFATTRDRMARDIMIEVEKHCPKRLVRIFGLIKNLLEPAIKKVREGEDEIFRNLQTFGEAREIHERLDLILQRE